MGSKWQVEEEFQVEETLGKLVADGISRFHPFDRVNSTLPLESNNLWMLQSEPSQLESMIHIQLYKQLIFSVPSLDIWHIWTSSYPWFFVPRMARFTKWVWNYMQECGSG